MKIGEETKQDWSNFQSAVLQLVGAILFAIGSVLIVVSTYKKQPQKNYYIRSGSWVWFFGSLLFFISAIFLIWGLN